MFQFGNVFYVSRRDSESIENRFQYYFVNNFQQFARLEAMGQNTRSQGISFTNASWEEIEQRCRELKCGRSQYFQMLVEADLISRPEIHAHKSDGKWHFYPEKAVKVLKK